MHSIKSEDLLLYLYGETSKEATKTIEAALQSDWSLQEKLELLKAGIQELDTIQYKPSQRSINQILNYAHKSVEELAPQA